MTCPNCLAAVAGFPLKAGAEGGNYPACPQCGGAVPTLYARDAWTHPPIVFSLVGFRSHGKTLYLISLLLELMDNPLKLPFDCRPADEAAMNTINELVGRLRQGKPPAPTTQLFESPGALRLDGRSFGRKHLLMYDMPGERFESVSNIKGMAKYNGYVSRTPTLLLLVSLDDLPASKLSLTGFLTVYTQAAIELGGNPKNQNLVVVLSKGDRLVDETGLPQAIRRAFSPTLDARELMDLARLEALSWETEAWLQNKPECVSFVRRARKEFRRVEYCVVSATGVELHEGHIPLDGAKPSVLAPLIWASTLSQEQTSWYGPVIGEARKYRRALRRTVRGQVIRSYKRALSAPSVLEYCHSQGLNVKLQDALNELNTGVTDLAKRLLHDYNQHAGKA